MADFPDCWNEISKKFFYNMLECLPPLKMRPLKKRSNAFLVGECYKHTSEGAWYRACVQIKDKFYSKIVLESSWNPVAYSQEIIKQFGLEE